MKLYFTGRAFYMDRFELDTDKLPDHYVEIHFGHDGSVRRQIMNTKEYRKIAYMYKPPMYMNWYGEIDKWNYDTLEWEMDYE